MTFKSHVSGVVITNTTVLMVASEPEPEGMQPDGHALPPETNYRAADVIDHWVGQLGRAYIEDGTAAKLYEAGYTSIQDMDFDPEELMDLGFPKPRARNMWRAMSALRERYLGPGTAVLWPRQVKKDPEVVVQTNPTLAPTLARLDIASFDAFPATTGGGCGIGGLPEVDVIVGHLNKVVGGLAEHSREGARLLGTIVDNPHQPLTPILGSLPPGFDGLVARIITRGMSATMHHGLPPRTQKN